MNYKNNLLTKKKYKIVNQKGGKMEYWTFCVHYTDYIPNIFSEGYIEKQVSPSFFNIKIGKYSWALGIGGNHYSITNVNNELVELRMDENQFINFLLDNEEFRIRLNFVDRFSFDGKNWDYNRNLCILYRIAFFECIPPEFEDLYNKIFEIIKRSFNKYKREKEKTIEHIHKSQRKLTTYETNLIKCTKPISEGGIGVIELMQMCAKKVNNPQLKCVTLTSNICPKYTTLFEKEIQKYYKLN
jgi:hypothetical protein